MRNQKPPLIEFRNITKVYGSIVANDNLSFEVQQGVIHAIIGENGAGKSTAMKLLFGLEKPTSGEIFYKGRPKLWATPTGALGSGVGMVHQHFMLSDRHTALDNVILSRESNELHLISSQSWWRWFNACKRIDRDLARRKLENISNKLNFNIQWDELVQKLPVGVHQQLEIIKLLHADVDTMIFDEPTAVLSPIEKNKFLEFLKEQKKSGKTVILITHKLQEVKEVADVVTTLRRGHCVGTKLNKEMSIQQMADLMVGKHVNLEELPRENVAQGAVVINVENLTVLNKIKQRVLTDVNFHVNAGEVVGVAGVEGNGQMELLNFFCGPKDYLVEKVIDSGCFSIFGEDGLELTRAHVRDFSFGLVPSDRLREAVMLSENLVENDLLGHDDEFFEADLMFGSILNRRRVKERLEPVLTEFDVRPSDPDQPISSLSGGNQQKFVVGREFSRSPKLILLAEPTRGVDIGSIEKIHREILRRRDQGAAVVVFSSQIEELMSLSDRISVMFNGSIVKNLERKEFSDVAIGRAMVGLDL